MKKHTKSVRQVGVWMMSLAMGANLLMGLLPTMAMAQRLPNKGVNISDLESPDNEKRLQALSDAFGSKTINATTEEEFNLQKPDDDEIKRQLSEITLKDLLFLVEKKISKDISKVFPSLTSKYKKEFLRANLELNKKITLLLGEDRKIKDVSPEELDKAMKEVLAKNNDLKETIRYTGEKIGEDNIVSCGQIPKKSFLKQIFGIKDAIAQFTLICDYDNRWPGWAKLESKWGSYHTATGVDRVKNDPNEICDYRVHFNAANWKTSDGYYYMDWLMINYYGGLNYSSSGDRVIVGYNGAYITGHYTANSVRYGVIMRTW